MDQLDWINWQYPFLLQVHIYSFFCNQIFVVVFSWNKVINAVKSRGLLFLEGISTQFSMICYWSGIRMLHGYMFMLPWKSYFDRHVSNFQFYYHLFYVCKLFCRNLIYLFMYLFIYSFIYWLIDLFIELFIYLFVPFFSKNHQI